MHEHTMQEPVKLNTRGQYAVRAMVELAKASDKNPLPLSETASNAGVSLSYLEQLIAGMRRHDLVKSYRGPGGGYVLAKSPEDIIIVDILRAAEDSTPAKRVGTNSHKTKICDNTETLWEHIGQLLGVTLGKTTLAEVINNSLENNPHTRKVFEVLSQSA